MKKFCLIVLTLLWAVSAAAIEKSSTVVVINGAKYYIHTVRAGETLYSLSKTYGIGEQVLIENNPSAASGIKTDERLKIPFVADVPKAVSERKLRKNFDMHYVERGETLYAISRRYAIPIPTIISDNPNLDPIHLRPDERILIRRTERGTEPASEVQMQWEQYKDNLNSVAGADIAYHLIHAGETFYSIARRYGITESELSALNNGLQAADLRAGAIIRVPGAVEPIEPAGAVPAEHFPKPVVPESGFFSGPRADFRPLDRSQTLRVALLLPIAADGKTNANYLEFYQGFLLGLDSVKHEGFSVHLDLYNTGRNPEKVRQIVDSGALDQVNLIVGPVYEEMLDPVVRFASQREIPVVSPLAGLTQIHSDVVFQLSPAPETKYEKIADLIDGSKKLTLIYTDSTDQEFEAEILDMLGSSVYTKRSISSDANTRSKGVDLSPMLRNGDDNVFIIMSDNEVDVDRILAAMSSANTGIVSRGYPAPKYVVLGNTRWNRYNNIDRTMFFKNRVIFLSSYHAKRDSEIVRHFDSTYIRAFGSLPTLYSYRGYDSAVLFCPAMFGDIRYDLEGESYTPLQTTYVFGQQEAGDNNVNRNWTRVNYNSDFTITIE